MKKIMFNDKYGLTQAVLEGRKTQTRRSQYIMPDGSPSIAITPLVRHNLQERRKAKRRKR